MALSPGEDPETQMSIQTLAGGEAMATEKPRSAPAPGSCRARDGGVATSRRRVLAPGDAARAAPRQRRLAAGNGSERGPLFILGALNWSLEWYNPTKDAPAHLARSLLAAFTR